MVATKPAEGIWEDIWVPTACDMCYNSCTIRVRRVNGIAVQIEGIPEAPPNYGKTCAKGNAALMNLYNPHRIKTPLRRTNPEKGLSIDPLWQEISWDEALDIVTDKLRAARQKDPRSVVAATFDRYSHYVLRSFLSAFGSPNLTTVSAGFFCGNGMHPVAYTLTGSNDVHPDLHRCDYLLMFGTSYGFVSQMNAMGLTQEMADARRRGMKLIVVDPLLSYAASQADEWVPIRPGTDAALALALMEVIVLELGTYDAEYLKRYTNSPYLINPDGTYHRDPASEKPLVWSLSRGEAVPFDEADPMDMALEGSFSSGAVQVRPGFDPFKEHLRAYTPERVAEITTVPAATIRRLARDLAEHARIGATIQIEGKDLPLRPASATWYRGVSAHKHGMLNGMSIAQLNLMLGNVDVPGGLLNASAAGPYWGPRMGPDGLMATGNPFTGRHMRTPIPPQQVKQPETLELVELFPVSVYSRAMLWLGVLQPEEYGLPYRAEVLLQCRTNMMATAGDPEIMGEALRRIPFVCSFADHHNETTQFADLVLPDTHALERLVPIVQNPYYHYTNAPMPGEEWSFNVQQPVVPPQGQARYWIEVLLEVAGRLDLLPDLYSTFNAIANLEGPYRLDPNRRYSWEEICDLFSKSYCGEEHGIDFFKQHGYFKGEKRSAEQSYPRSFHEARIALYLEHFIHAGEAVRSFTRSKEIPWDTDDYMPLVEWRPCPAYSQAGSEYDLFLVNHKLPFMTFSFTIENRWLTDLADRNAKIFNVGINAETARRKGIRDGDTIEIESSSGLKAQGLARLTQGLHPECVAVPSILGRQITSNDKVRGRGIHFNSLLRYNMDRLDTLSAALDSCVKVRIRKV